MRVRTFKHPGKRPHLTATAFMLALIAMPAGGLAEAINRTCGGLGQPWSEARFVETKALYLDNYCGYCHGLAAVGSRGIFGPLHDTAKAAAEHYIRDPAYSGQASTPRGYLSESIAQPGVYVTPGYGATTHQMPTYEGMLTDAQINELATFLLVYGDCSLESS